MNRNVLKVFVFILFLVTPSLEKSTQKKDDITLHDENKNGTDDLTPLIQRNDAIVKKDTENDPDYYSRHASGQSPKYLWIGCSDSRVTPERMIGAQIGEVFVHRNVANQIKMGDNSAMAVLEYAVNVLGVDTIIIAGHYGCGGIKATFNKQSLGSLESWINDIREIRYRYRDQMTGDQAVDEPKLVELNVREQVHRVARTPFIQNVWTQGKTLSIYGVVYDVSNGRLLPTNYVLKNFRDLENAEIFYS